MATAPAKATADWQLVLVLWGTKYPASEVNFLIDTVLRQADPAPRRIVMLTDRPRPDLRPEVMQKDIPAFFNDPKFLTGGCHAKLCMFETGLVPPDMPAIFVDIDTVVLGNLARLLDLMKNRRTVAIFQSAVLPFGALARLLFRLSGERIYARGNSSIVVYHPAECGHIARRFREIFPQFGFYGFRPLMADERFISWAHQPDMRAIPHRMAVKLPTEFMLPWRWLILLRARMPWVQRRWDGLIAVTLPGAEVKGPALLTLAEGEEVVDGKGRRLIWSEAAMGTMKAKLTRHYRELQERMEAEQ